MKSARATQKARLPYGMFLTHLFRYVMEHYPYLNNGIYNVVDQVMYLLALRQTRKPRSGPGIHKACYSVSSSSTHHYGSSSHQEDDDDNEGTSRAIVSNDTIYNDDADDDEEVESERKRSVEDLEKQTQQIG
uniref:Ribosomal protein L7Ae/L30e/S12e/Gadd45 n=1 Tax=Tanacetum cinerariifolium TaxID=118510 RepID=A0A699I1L1_TANCI|nr:hypothetical protein CTI12_AA055610 [Tanacetum cinerariifolium]